MLQVGILYLYRFCFYNNSKTRHDEKRQHGDKTPLNSLQNNPCLTSIFLNKPKTKDLSLPFSKNFFLADGPLLFFCTPLKTNLQWQAEPIFKDGSLTSPGVTEVQLLYQICQFKFCELNPEG